MNNEFRAGNVWSQTFNVVKSNFPVMLLFAALNYIPTLADNILGEESSAYLSLSMIMAVMLPLLLQGAMVYGVYRYLTGHPFAVSLAINSALGRNWHLLGFTIVVNFLACVGHVILFIPGIVSSLILFVAIPVAMVEDVSVGQALARSRDLTSGRLWRLFGLGVIATIFYILMAGASLGVQIVVGGYSLDSEVVNTGMSLRALVITTPLGILTEGLSAAVFGVVGVVSYYELRRDKEGTAVEDLAAVFE